ncbi:MAG: helix-turn-helix domain-containing protein [Lachnospiraceae bacterium]|nr:helix-turn-helix domain-containing protein [Lachnospiraceae bacterium]
MAKVTLGKWTDKNESFSRKIRANRIEEGVGIDILAKKAGIKRSTYFSHLRDPEQITLRELRAYCNTLRIPAESLLSAVYEGGD